MSDMQKVIKEGFVYKEKEESDPAGAFYCVLKPNILCFHLRKGHKRHTPLRMFKIEDISIKVNDEVDCNGNNKKFQWQIIAQDYKMFLYCGTDKERDSWVQAIQNVKDKLGFVSEQINDTNKGPHEVEHENGQYDCLTKENNSELATEKSEDLKCCSESDIVVESVYNSSHTRSLVNKSMGNKVECSPQRQRVRRLRSRSLSELIEPTNFPEHELYPRCLKSNSAPPESGGNRRGFKTVDKLIDVQTIWCRQLVRWI